MRRFLLALLVLLGSASALEAQGVVVAPHAVYLDHRTRSASITLYNPGAEPTEVAIEFLFGYPVTDSLGDFTLAEPDSVTAEMPSAHRWIEAFPRRMTLGPLQRQTVRLLARPPANLPDGEYWARVVIVAKGGSVPVSGADSANISVGLNLEIRTRIPLTYRKGVLQSGIGVSALAAHRTAADSLAIRMHLARQNTAAYVGTARGSLINQSGKIVGSFMEPVAVYYDATPAFAIPVAGLPAGTYTLKVELSSDRPDIAPEILLKSATVRDSIAVVLP
jgi:P pilus assembly chaperone PapD